MGCSISRMNSVEGAVPEKIRPLFFRRHRPAAAPMQRESTLSKKKLLKEEDEDINPNNHSSDEAEAAFKPAVSSPRKAEPTTNKVTPLPELDSEYETFTDAENHNGNSKQTLQEKDTEADNVKDTQQGEETAAENEHEQEQEQVEEKNDDFEFNILACPGSPSFRIYCLSPQNNKDESKSQETLTHQKSCSVESVQSPASASGHVKTPSADSTHSATSSHNSKILNDGAETESASKRRRNRRKKFRAVKNIMAVKSLYTSCSFAVDRPRLAAAKTMK